MVDPRKTALLNLLGEQFVGDEYKIFALEDFSPCLAEGKEEEAIHLLKGLEEEGYIHVKYAGGGLYCLRLFPSGKGYGERENERLLRVSFERKEVKISAFLGGVFGGAVAVFFFWILQLLF